MKKSILILLISIVALAKAQTTQTVYIDPVTHDTARISTTVTNSTILSRYKQPVIIPPPIAVKQLNDYFDHVHTAINSLNSAGAIAINGQSVYTIAAEKGGIPIPWGGLPVTSVTKVPPALIDTNWISFFNTPLEYITKQVISVAAPFTYYFVTRTLPGTQYEGMFEGYDNALYFADGGGNYRTGSSNSTIPNSKQAPYYQTTIHTLVVNPTSIDYYQNGIFIGTATTTAALKKVFALGNDGANCMDYDWQADYFKAGTLSTTDAATVYSLLAAKYHPGSYPNHILLSNIKWQQLNGVYSGIATDQNGNAVDMSKCKFEWYWMSNATNIGGQVEFSTNQTVTTADFPTGYATMPGFSIRFRVMASDGWHYIFGQYGLYTQKRVPY